MQYGSLQGAGGHAANEQQWTPSRPIADTPRRPCLREVLSLAFGVFVVFMLSVFVKSWQHYGITSKAGLDIDNRSRRLYRVPSHFLLSR